MFKCHVWASITVPVVDKRIHFVIMRKYVGIIGDSFFDDLGEHHLDHRSIEGLGLTSLQFLILCACKPSICETTDGGSYWSGKNSHLPQAWSIHEKMSVLLTVM